MSALYNEIEPYAVQWLTNLADRGHIAPGRIDGRSILDVRASELAPFSQCHFFAGVGVWSYALRLAGVPDDFPVWTGSCPCQPFSTAGRGGGFDDARHLWPDWFKLIEQCRPPVVFGEQVASRDGLGWLDAVSADLEGAGYAFGAADLCAAGVGAPHVRQRLFFVAYARDERCDGLDALLLRWRQDEARLEVAGRGEAGELGNADVSGGGRDAGTVPRAQAAGGGEGLDSRRLSDEPVASGAVGVLDDAFRPGLEGLAGDGDGATGRDSAPGPASAPGAVGGFWSDAEWLPCRDGKSRPVEPGTFPLAHGAPARVGRLRAYGNAINAEVAATFIRAALGSIDRRASQTEVAK